MSAERRDPLFVDLYQITTRQAYTDASLYETGNLGDRPRFPAGPRNRQDHEDVQMRSMRNAVVVALAALLFAGCAGDKTAVEVWKSASCGCCTDWVRHLEANGFEVRV